MSRPLVPAPRLYRRRPSGRYLGLLYTNAGNQSQTSIASVETMPAQHARPIPAAMPGGACVVPAAARSRIGRPCSRSTPDWAPR